MASAKFWKRTTVILKFKEISKNEEVFAKALLEVENVSNEHKKDLKNFLIDSVKEVEVFS